MTDKPIKVAHLYSVLQRTGGIERIIKDLSIRGPDYGIQSQIYLLNQLPSKDQLPVPGVQIIYPKFAWLYRRLSKVSVLRPVAKAVARLDLTTRVIFSDASIVQIHRGMDRSSILSALCFWAAGKKIIRSIQGNLPQGRRDRLWRLQKLANKTVAAFVTLTPDGKDYAVSVRPIDVTNVSVIPVGIDVSSFVAAKTDRDSVRQELGLQDKFVILQVSRLDLRQKDFFSLINAFAIFEKECPEARLLVCGEGSGRRRVETFISETGLGDKVQMLGFYEDLPRLMAGADLFAFSSFHEGFGIVAAEAMAAGLPVVATDIVGLRSVCGYGTAGVLVPPNNPEAMARAFLQIYTDQALRDRLVKEGYERVRNEYDVGVMMRRYSQLYRQIAG